MALAPGTKVNQGFVKMAQGRSQTLFCVFLSFIPLLSRCGDICGKQAYNVANLSS